MSNSDFWKECQRLWKIFCYEYVYCMYISKTDEIHESYFKISFWGLVKKLYFYTLMYEIKVGLYTVRTPLWNQLCQ